MSNYLNKRQKKIVYGVIKYKSESLFELDEDGC